jgi:ribose transport system substrate-binding protein
MHFTKILAGLAAALLISSGSVLAQKSYTIGMVAKSQGNPFFEAARAGANDAARDLSAKHGIRVRIDWRTPNEEDAQKQAEFIEQLLLTGADGILVSCSDANRITDAINKAAGQGVPVATFSGDAAASKRFVALGIDDFKCGEQTMHELARLLNGRGVIAAINGNQNAPNLQRRGAGFRAAAKKYPNIELRDIYYHRETPQDAVARIEQVMQSNPDITGWGLLGGWPLFTDNALKWPPGTIKCVSVDALPQQLPYVRSGHVQLLLSQDVYGYGYRGVEHLINKIHLRKNPPQVDDATPLTAVTRENLDEFAKNWEKWLPK